MTSRLLRAAVCLSYLMWPSSVAVPPPPPVNQFPISEILLLTPTQEQVAQQVESRLRSYGFSDELIIGALINAYAESELDTSAVGSEGERGIFQLHPKGLGRRMSIDEMEGIDTSVDRIVRALRKSERIMRMEDEGATAAEYVAAFCIDIERPSDKRRKARARVGLMGKILIN
jgi:hypothetical protein